MSMKMKESSLNKESASGHGLAHLLVLYIPICQIIKNRWMCLMYAKSRPKKNIKTLVVTMLGLARHLRTATRYPCDGHHRLSTDQLEVRGHRSHIPTFPHAHL